MKKVKGLRSTNWLLQNSHVRIKCSIKNIANNILIIICGVRLEWDSVGRSLSKLYAMFNHWGIHLKLI